MDEPQPEQPVKTQAPQRQALKRRVVHIGGYDPMGPEASHRRFSRESRRFASTWAIDCQVHEPRISPGDVRWGISSGAPDWASDVQHIMLRWDDVIEQDRARNWLTRLPLGLWSFVDFVGHGALWRYLRFGWRYAGFFLYPFILLALLAAVAFFAGQTLAGLSGVGRIEGWVVSLVLFGALLHWPGGRLYLDHLVDDWIYASLLIRRGDATIAGRLDALARELAGADDSSELIITGHSLGAVHAAGLIRRILALSPEGPPIRFASVGSSILKMAFHSGAKAIRDDLVAIAASPRVIWCEFHALNDVMNFYKVEPMAALKLPGRPALTRVVKFRPMVDPAFYKRMERNFFRLHCQFISGNDRRAPYDYFVMICGPFPMEALVAEPDGALGWLDEAGGLTPAALPHLSAAG
jgi:hypothetical protein